MSTDDPTRDWHERLLDRILPGETETALLRACLADAADRPAARHAWQQFIARVAEPKRYFESASGGLKGLLPFVEDCVRRNRIDAPAAFLTYARVAAVREELRDRIYREVFGHAWRALQQTGIRPLVLRGLPLSVSCYATPSKRHNHGIDLLLDVREIESATRVLLRLGCRHAPDERNTPTATRLLHSSGLPLALHTQLFELPHLTAPIDAIRARAVAIEIDGQPVATLSAEDHLLHVCGHASYASSRGNLRWACDAAQLIRVHHRAIDWQRFIATAEHSRLALPMAVLLRYLQQITNDVPEYVVAALRTRHRLSESVAREAIYAMCMEHPTRPLPRWSIRGEIGCWLSFCRFRLLPSRQFAAWKYRASGVSLVACYVCRPFRYLARCSAQLLRATRGNDPVMTEQAL